MIIDKKIIDVIEEAKEEIENIYGRETELTEKLSNIIDLYYEN